MDSTHPINNLCSRVRRFSCNYLVGKYQREREIKSSQFPGRLNPVQVMNISLDLFLIFDRILIEDRDKADEIYLVWAGEDIVTGR